MESVIIMMRDVEDLEKAAVHAKEEAFRGGLDILARVEEIKNMLLHAKEANDMHAGEVYGEKAILATEARELQSRLLNLSYERGRSLAILNEGSYLHHKEVKAAQGIKITAQGLEHAIPGTALYVVGPDDNVDDVCVQASTFGSLEDAHGTTNCFVIYNKGIMIGIDSRATREVNNIHYIVDDEAQKYKVLVTGWADMPAVGITAMGDSARIKIV